MPKVVLIYLARFRLAMIFFLPLLISEIPYITT